MRPVADRERWAANKLWTREIMVKKIFSVGTAIPGGDVEHIYSNSNQSLLDADIIVFEPTLGSASSLENYQNKPLFSETASFNIVERAEHWRAELTIAFEAGKTIIVFLSALEEVYVHTGQKQYSGTGKSRVTTNLVKSFDNYQSIPFDLGTIIPKGGTEIRVIGDSKFLAAYWKEFGQYSVYEIYLEKNLSGTVLATKTGNKTVGAVIRGPKQKGAMVFLPPIRKFPESRRSKEYGKKLVNAIVEIDKVLKAEHETCQIAAKMGHAFAAKVVHVVGDVGLSLLRF
jgi:hypothetical protein